MAETPICILLSIGSEEKPRGGEDSAAWPSAFAGQGEQGPSCRASASLGDAWDSEGGVSDSEQSPLRGRQWASQFHLLYTGCLFVPLSKEKGNKHSGLLAAIHGEGRYRHRVSENPNPNWVDGHTSCKRGRARGLLGPDVGKRARGRGRKKKALGTPHPCQTRNTTRRGSY